VIWWIACWFDNRDVRGSNTDQVRNSVPDFSYTCALCQKRNSVTMSTLTVHCRWKDETVRESNGRQPSYAMAKNISRYHFIPMAVLGLA